jgi:putative RecB family exonuclease
LAEPNAATPWRKEKKMRTTQDHDHLSYSQINTYLSCSLKYKLQYVDKVPPAFTSASLAFGSAIHEAAAAFYQTRLEGEELRPDQMLDVYRETWGQAEKVKFFNGDNEDKLAKKAEELLNVFQANSDPSIQVVGVEEFFELPLGGLPPFHGYIDLIEQDNDGKVTIADLKTASKKLSDSNVHSNLQLTAYVLGGEALGFDPDSLTMRLDVLTKTKNPEMVKYETTRSEDDRHRFIRLVYSVWNGIERGVFFPKEDWHCSQCAWAKQCAEW